MILTVAGGLLLARNGWPNIYGQHIRQHLITLLNSLSKG